MVAAEAEGVLIQAPGFEDQGSPRATAEPQASAALRPKQLAAARPLADAVRISEARLLPFIPVDMLHCVQI